MSGTGTLRTWASELVLVTGAFFRYLAVELYQWNRLMRDELSIQAASRAEPDFLNFIAAVDLISPLAIRTTAGRGRGISGT
jgi:hypothetical protein